MLVASIGIPLLLNGLQMPAEPSHQAEENAARVAAAEAAIAAVERIEHARAEGRPDADLYVAAASRIMDRSEEHTSELQSLMRISYAVFCLKNKTTHRTETIT